MPRAARLARVSAAALALVVLGAPPPRALELQPPRESRAQMEAALAAAPAFRFVYGTQDPRTAAVLREYARLLATRAFGVSESQVSADRDADERQLASGPVYLVGSARENLWTRRWAAQLPASFDDAGFVWRGQHYTRAGDALHLAWPHPLAPRYFLLLSAGNSPAALAAPSGLMGSGDDWRIVRDGVLARSGRFAQEAGRPWRYDPALDRDREAERQRFTATLRTLQSPGVKLRAAPGAAEPAAVLERASAVLARLTRAGFAAPPGAPPLVLTLHRSLEAKGVYTRDTHAEHLTGEGAHVARPTGRAVPDLWSVAALRLQQAGASADSRFLMPAAVAFAGRFEGEPLERACARVYFGGLLPNAAEAATRDDVWRSPLAWVPARALLVLAVSQCARPPVRAAAVRALLQRDAPGALDSLCHAAGVSAGAVEHRYRVLADSLGREGQRMLRPRAREPWRPAAGFQRGVVLTHAHGVERGYLSAEAARSLAALREAGADAVVLEPTLWLADPSQPALSGAADADPDAAGDEAIAEAVARAHALGMRVWLSPQVRTRGWEGELAFSRSGWERFLGDYGARLQHWALFAEREGVDGLVIAHELSSATLADPARWRAWIGGTRKVFSGLLTYGAAWSDVESVPFWDALDGIGVSFGAPLAAAPTRDAGALRAGAARALERLRALARRAGRPVFVLELGYPAAPDAAVRPWEAAAGATDPEAQRACLEAAVAAMDPCEWIGGACFARWSSAPGMPGALELRDRPAAAVVLQALRAWQGRPVRVPAASGR